MKVQLWKKSFSSKYFILASAKTKKICAKYWLFQLRLISKHVRKRTFFYSSTFKREPFQGIFYTSNAGNTIRVALNCNKYFAVDIFLHASPYFTCISFPSWLWNLAFVFFFKVSLRAVVNVSESLCSQFFFIVCGQKTI